MDKDNAKEYPIRIRKNIAQPRIFCLGKWAQQTIMLLLHLVYSYLTNGRGIPVLPAKLFLGATRSNVLVQEPRYHQTPSPSVHYD